MARLTISDATVGFTEPIKVDAKACVSVSVWGVFTANITVQRLVGNKDPEDEANWREIEVYTEPVEKNAFLPSGGYIRAGLAYDVDWFSGTAEVEVYI